MLMFDYSVITPADDQERHFFIVPLADEDRFVSDSGPYTVARLDLMLEILNGYQAHVQQHSDSFETEHFHYSRVQLEEGMLAKVTARKH